MANADEYSADESTEPTAGETFEPTPEQSTPEQPTHERPSPMPTQASASTPELTSVAASSSAPFGPASVQNPSLQQPALKHHFRRISLAVAGLLAVSLIGNAVLGTLLATRGNQSDATRTVSVTGDATISATPDEYDFYPSYTFKGTDKDAALAQLTKQSDAIVAQLKKLGVADKDIKTSSNGYDSPMYYMPAEEPNGTVTYSLQLTVKVSAKDMAQKVQDYLVTTSPTGSVSPQAAFSDAKQKQLEGQARDQATKDARSKADQSAKNLGFKVGKVQTVTDGSGFGSKVYPNVAPMAADAAGSSVSNSLAVQPGQNDLNYTVTVVYEIR